jgi:hypothetical protein
MIERNETSRFLGGCCRPAEHFFMSVLPLKAGFNLCAGVDVLVALTALADMCGVLPRDVLEAPEVSPLERILLTLCGGVAVAGAVGIATLRKALVDLYCTYKYLELFLVACISYVLILSALETWANPSIAFLYICTRVTWDTYATYIIWSCSIRIRNGETLLLFYGREVAEILTHPQQEMTALKPLQSSED